MYLFGASLLFIFYYFLFGKIFLELVSYSIIYWFFVNFFIFIFIYIFFTITVFLFYINNMHRFSFIITNVFILIIFSFLDTHLNFFLKESILFLILFSSFYAGAYLSNYPKFLDYLLIFRNFFLLPPFFFVVFNLFVYLILYVYFYTPFLPSFLLGFYFGWLDVKTKDDKLFFLILFSLNLLCTIFFFPPNRNFTLFYILGVFLARLYKFFFLNN